MATFRQIREGIATNLQGISGLQESAYVLGAATLPAAQVAPMEIDYDKAFRRGLDALWFKVMVLAGSVSDIGAQKLLDPFLDPSGSKSIKAAVESDDTLGGLVESVRVTRCTGYRLYERTGQSPALGAEWTIEVWMEGTA